MPKWPRYPTIYEVDTWVWLSDLTQKLGSSVDLSCVPSAEWDAIATYGFDAVWLMGVWERSPAGIAIANRNENLLERFPPSASRFPTARQCGIALLRAAVRC